MGGRIFECLDAVINRYRKEQIVEGYTLQHPVSICLKSKRSSRNYFYVSEKANVKFVTICLVNLQYLFRYSLKCLVFVKKILILSR